MTEEKKEKLSEDEQAYNFWNDSEIWVKLDRFLNKFFDVVEILGFMFMLATLFVLMILPFVLIIAAICGKVVVK